MKNVVQTDRPHIQCKPGICGGEPIIDGLRVTVRHVATLHEQGEAVEIAEALGLTEAQVSHALSYYFDHRDEILRLIAAAEQRAILTFNIRDFAPIHEEWSTTGRHQSGIIVSQQLGRRQDKALLGRMTRLLSHFSRDDPRDNLVHLARFR
jgi:uncharacterized protein (DUF433 family)